MIEFSCQSWAFNDLSLQEALGTVARLGFRGVDLGSGAHFNPVKAAADPRRVAAEITGDLRIFNLKLTDVYVMLPNITDPDERKRRREIDLFKAVVPCLQAVNTGGVTLSPGVQPPDEDMHDTAREHATGALREMIAAADGLSVSIEPHLDSIAATPDAALQLVEAVPGLRLTLDLAHFICQGTGLKAVTPLLPHTRHIQVRQAAPGKLQTTFDKGKLDPAAVMTQLHTAGYDGVICVEYMKSVGWHGMEEVNAIREGVQMRDALRAARDTVVV